MFVMIIAVACLILSFALQKSLRDQGIDPLSRGQMRYMRRKARKQGLDISQIDYNPRRGTTPFPKSAADKETAKILRDFKRTQSGIPPKPRRRK